MKSNSCPVGASGGRSALRFLAVLVRPFAGRCRLRGRSRFSAKLETWRQEGASAFAKHHRERVVISDKGRVRLGHALVPSGSLAAERVWDLAPGSEGRHVYAATGDAGKVFRRARGAASPGPWRSTPPTPRPSRLAARPTARSSSAPDRAGRSIEVTDPKHPASRPDPKRAVHLGPGRRRPGQPVRRDRPQRAALEAVDETASGRWSSTARRRTCSASPSAPDGAVYAGSDGEGLIYRVGPRRQGRRSSTTPPRPRSAPSWSAPTARSTPGRRPRRAAAAASRTAVMFSDGSAGSRPATPASTRHAASPGRPADPPVEARAVSVAEPDASGPAAGRPSGGSAVAQARLARRERRLPDRSRRRRPARSSAPRR